MRKRIPILILAAAALCGCGPDVTSQPPEPKDPGVISNHGAVGATVEKGAVMAVVNGQPIYMSQLYEVLLRGQGLEMSQQLIATEVVQQEANRQGVSVTEADVQAEHLRLLAVTFPTLPEIEQRERALAKEMERKGVSRMRWDLIVRRNAYLHKLAGPRVQVSEEQLRQEYADQYGRKVEVRHIELESLDEVERVQKQLRLKASFEDLARRVSKNVTGAQGGLLPLIGREGPKDIPDLIRQVALALKEPGDVSEPVRVGYAYHLLRLERVIEPTSQPYEGVKEKLRAAVTERQTWLMQQVILNELLNPVRNKCEYVDPLLRELITAAGGK